MVPSDEILPRYAKLIIHSARPFGYNKPQGTRRKVAPFWDRHAGNDPRDPRNEVASGKYSQRLRAIPNEKTKA